MEEYRKWPRLYLDAPGFAPGAEAALPEAQAHYLRNVMRRGAGDPLRVFNGRDGEWRAEVREAGKKKTSVRLVERIRAQDLPARVEVLASPLRREAFSFMIEKACELGAAGFTPVLCAQTSARDVNVPRAQATAIEAAEQCERTDVMQVRAPLALSALLAGWDPARKIVLCLERARARPVAQALREMETPPAAVMTGPEGGFSDAEIAMLAGYGFILPVSLGPRILRAETALCAVLSCVQALAGDWT